MTPGAICLVIAILICFIITQYYILKIDNKHEKQYQELRYEIEKLKKLDNINK